MSQRLVPVAMFMLYLKTNRNIVGVSMVRIVDMLMFVFNDFVHMFVHVVLGQVQPDSHNHQSPSNQ